MVASPVVTGGFADPVFDSQSAFRAAMDALARPGTRQPLRPRPAPPAPLMPAAASILLTLCDADSPVWLDPALAASGDVPGWISFHTGAPVVANPAEAHFAFAARPAELISLENFAQGSHEYPDRSATIVLQVETLDDGTALELSGPGIRETASIAPSPLPRHFVEQWRQNRARFPRGVDVLMVGPDAVAGLPRTVSIAAGG